VKNNKILLFLCKDITFLLFLQIPFLFNRMEQNNPSPLQEFATRLHEALAYLNTNAIDFAQKIGETKENATLWTSAQAYPDSKTLLKMIAIFPQVNWFYVWEGDIDKYGKVNMHVFAALSLQNNQFTQEIKQQYEIWEHEHKMLEETQKQLKVMQKENHLLSELYQLIKNKYTLPVSD
jgi:hypothetical protein